MPTPTATVEAPGTRFPRSGGGSQGQTARQRLVDFRNSIGDYPSRADLATVTVPIVCSYGARSPDTMLRDVRALAAAIPKARTHRIEGSGHAVPFDATTAFVQLIGDAIAASRRAGHRAGTGDTEAVGFT
jgi:pimeloyl-ACP methyl ester carboxylesterase